MGAGQSLPSQNQPPSKALHVLRVTPSSPASKTDIEPFFDFVVGFQGDALTNNLDAAELEKIVESHEGKTLNLVVWNSKNQESRGTVFIPSIFVASIPSPYPYIDNDSVSHTSPIVVPIVPSRAWTQSAAPIHESDIKPSLLGLSVRMCEPEFSLESVWHVLDVLEGSPAESAGLVPYGDWVIGWSGGVLSAEGDFYDVVEAVRPFPSPPEWLRNAICSTLKNLCGYMYTRMILSMFEEPCGCLLTQSCLLSTIREVVLVPNRHWGGEGLLGCVFG